MMTAEIYVVEMSSYKNCCCLTFPPGRTDDMDQHKQMKLRRIIRNCLPIGVGVTGEFITNAKLLRVEITRKYKAGGA